MIKRYHDEGQRKDDLPLMQWCSTHALYQIQQALVGVLDNLPMRPAAWIVKGLIFPWGSSYSEPSDKLGALVARALLEDKKEREELTRDIYIPPASEPGLGRLEAALDKAVDALKVEARIRDAIRAGKLDKAPGDELVKNAQRAGIITEDEVQVLHLADEARNEVIQVDAFPAHAPVSPSLLPISRSRPPPGALRG